MTTTGLNRYKITTSDGEKRYIYASDIVTAIAVFQQIQGLPIQHIEKIKRVQ